LGESFRYQFPRCVRPSYAVAFGYCVADAAFATYGVVSRGEGEGAGNAERAKEAEAVIAGVDTLLWQGLASVAIPGAVINGVVRAARWAVTARGAALPALALRWLPTAAGLGAIPFIVTPIDEFVDFALDNSTRKLLCSHD